MKLLSVCLLLLAGLSVSAQPLPPPGLRVDDGSIIDVLVVYSQNARAVAGGTHPQTIAMIDTAISGVNTAFTNSGVLTQLNVVQYQPVFYLEQVNVDFHADLNNLSGTSDGYLDDIHALRDYYAADLVLMVTGTWFYICTGDSLHTTVPSADAGFAVWEAKGLDDSAGIFNSQWIARTLGVDDTPPYDGGQVAVLNANRVAVANYRDSTDRVFSPVELLHNGGFEFDMDKNNVPDFWAAAGWVTGEKRACGVPSKVRSGLCSVKWKLTNPDAGTLTQSVGGGPINLNDTVTLTGYAKMTGTNACVTTVMVVKYALQPKHKQPLKHCISVAAGWALLTDSFSASDLVVKVNVRVKAAGNASVWLDDFSLISGPPAPRGGVR